MKNRNQIIKKSVELQNLLNVKQREYSTLHQIDMLSSTGNQLQEEINKTQGGIDILNWILK